MGASTQRWRLTVAGSLAMDPACVDHLRSRTGRLGLVANVNLLGSVEDTVLP
jgi:hypothetical protein